MNGQELGLLMPAVSWWPRQAVWDNWLPRNVPETTTTTTMTTMTTATTNIRCFDAKLDVTPESNGTSTSEHTSMAAKTQAPSLADLYSSLSLRENEKICLTRSPDLSLLNPTIKLIGAEKLHLRGESTNPPTDMRRPTMSTICFAGTTTAGILAGLSVGDPRS
ncbi:DOA kinase [Vespula squamosa]|uniref:DOA kinase n=1 Tax=Vespula squamosa TaxID=30214 RepID=A0ABD2A7P7_VESSQ